jgi:hypothetical protein
MRSVYTSRTNVHCGVKKQCLQFAATLLRLLAGGASWCPHAWSYDEVTDMTLSDLRHAL